MGKIQFNGSNDDLRMVDCDILKSLCGEKGGMLIQLLSGHWFIAVNCASKVNTANGSLVLLLCAIFVSMGCANIPRKASGIGVE